MVKGQFNVDRLTFFTDTMDKWREQTDDYAAGHVVQLRPYTHANICRFNSLKPLNYTWDWWLYSIMIFDWH